MMRADLLELLRQPATGVHSVGDLVMIGLLLVSGAVLWWVGR